LAASERDRLATSADPPGQAAGDEMTLVYAIVRPRPGERRASPCGERRTVRHRGSASFDGAAGIEIVDGASMATIAGLA
jgi:hypothetical protein